MRILGIGTNLEEFRILKINTNSKIEFMIDHLGGYSWANPYNNPRANLHISSTDSLSTSPDELAYINRGVLLGHGDQNLRAHNLLDKHK